MNKYSFKRIVLLILLTSGLLLGTQVYRTIANYEVNKQRFLNEVQVALDLSIEKYYADKARNNIFIMSVSGDDTMALSSFNRHTFKTNKEKLDSLLAGSATTTVNVNSSKRLATAEESAAAIAGAVANNSSASASSSTSSSSTGSKLKSVTSWSNTIRLTGDSVRTRLDSVSFRSGQNQEPIDSLVGNMLSTIQMQSLTKRIVVSLSEDTMELEALDKLLLEELKRKGLEFDYQLAHQSRSGNATFGERRNWELSTVSKSTYLRDSESVQINFENASLIILKRGIVDLLVSVALLFSVVGLLVYLYQIIKEQKELALIKDDLISNITHEFKTPIATISTALEGISSFNEANDKEKTLRYLGVSQGQLKKLNTMVEKLLETATIDSGHIQVNPEETNLAALTQRVCDNHKMLHEDRKVTVLIPEEAAWAEVDAFHMENALSNLVDNAIKYGGPEISISLEMLQGKPVWKIVDNGGAIDKMHQDRIFDKLYRIPKGNQHDVKGFGIGLYYTKEVVEKHLGTISLSVKKGYTCFTIKL